MNRYKEKLTNAELQRAIESLHEKYSEMPSDNPMHKHIERLVEEQVRRATL